MKKVYLICLNLLIALFLFNCEQNNEDVETTDLSGKLINHSECKYNTKSTIDWSEYADTVSCVEYFFDTLDLTLYIKHMNAGFNCCPGEISCIVSFEGDSILFEENESKADCKCDCLFDLDIEVNGLDSTKSYQLVFIEPYINNQDKLEFMINLADTNQGEFCVTRKTYPWGLSTIAE